MSRLELVERRSLGLVSVAVALLAFVILAWVPQASAATWTIQSTPNAPSAEHSNLYDIACHASETKPCVSVGKLTESGGKSAPYAQSWNGTSWTNITAKAPEGATAGELQSVGCQSGSTGLFCFAAGSYTSGGVTKPLILGGSQNMLPTVESVPSPEGASETVLKGVTCREPSLRGCIAVGYSIKSGKKTAFATGLNAEFFWATQSVPEPAGATSSELLGVDCPTKTFCEAVGSYAISAGEPQWAWAATYNGSAWTLQAVAKPSGSLRSTLLDVSCESTSSCTGVGAYRNSKNVQVSFVARWNGTSWTHQASPNPGGSTNTVFQGVDCVTTPCVAVGDWNNGKNWQPMAQEWNGSAWALDTTPNPEGATETIIEGVACRTTGCLSSGWYADSEGKRKTLGESR
jgi:hypothetical protein